MQQTGVTDRANRMQARSTWGLLRRGDPIERVTYPLGPECGFVPPGNAAGGIAARCQGQWPTAVQIPASTAAGVPRPAKKCGRPLNTEWAGTLASSSSRLAVDGSSVGND